MSSHSSGFVSQIAASYEERIQQLMGDNNYLALANAASRHDPSSLQSPQTLTAQNDNDDAEPSDLPLPVSHSSTFPVSFSRSGTSYRTQIKPALRSELAFIKKRFSQLNAATESLQMRYSEFDSMYPPHSDAHELHSLIHSNNDLTEKIHALLVEMKPLIQSINQCFLQTRRDRSQSWTKCSQLSSQYNSNKQLLNQLIKESARKHNDIHALLERSDARKDESSLLDSNVAPQEDAPPPPDISDDDDHNDSAALPPSSDDDDALPPRAETSDIDDDDDDRPPVPGADDLPDAPPSDDEPDDVAPQAPISDDDDDEEHALPSPREPTQDDVLPPDEDDLPPSVGSDDERLNAPEDPVDDDDSDDMPQLPSEASSGSLSENDMPPSFSDDDDSLMDDSDAPPQIDESSFELDDDLPIIGGQEESTISSAPSTLHTLQAKYPLSPSIINTSKLPKKIMNIAQNNHIKPLMKIIFIIKKLGKNSNLKRKRVLELDWLHGYIQTWQGSKPKTKYPVNLIDKIEKDATHPRLLRLYFASIGPQAKTKCAEYYFQSKFKRERFYECVKSILNFHLCCPDLIKQLQDADHQQQKDTPAFETCNVIISGSFRFKTLDGNVGRTQGERSFVATSAPFEHILLFCCTFSIGNAPEEPRDLRAFIPFNKCDMYCLAIQDDKTNWAARGTDASQAFVDYMKELIGREYLVVCHNQSASNPTLKFIIFARKRHIPKITNVKTEQVSLSKTACSLGISLTFNESQLLFINSQMPEKELDRQKLYEQTCSMSIGDKSIPILTQFDQLFWMGDMQYSIDMDMSIVTQLSLNPENIAQILEADSFSRCKNEQQSIFNGFEEGPVNFLPTCMQPPAYADRILWKSNSTNRVTCESYSSYSEGFDDSSHHPVFALFNVATERTFGSVFSVHPPCMVKMEYLSVYGMEKLVQKPVFVLSGPWLENAKVSPRLDKSSSPSWNIGLPVLRSITNHGTYMDQQCLQVQLFDGRVCKGSCSVPLIELKNHETGAFQMYSKQGKHTGFVKIRARITYS